MTVALKHRIDSFDRSLMQRFDGHSDTTFTITMTTLAADAAATSTDASAAMGGDAVVDIGQVPFWPIQTLLGSAEVLIVDPHCLVLALWPASRAHANVLRSGRASFAFVDQGGFYQLHCARVTSAEVKGLALHRMKLLHGEKQSVPYAQLESGIRYTLVDPEETMNRWQAQLALLREFATQA